MYGTTWMNLENSMPSERRDKKRSYVMSFLQNVCKRHVHGNTK